MSVKYAARETQQIPVDQITVGEKLSEIDKKRVIEKLNEYRDCFALELSELGKLILLKQK